MAAKLKKGWGGHVGQMARPVFTCQKCGRWHEGQHPPYQCTGLDCGNTTYHRFPSRAEAKRWGELNLLLAHKKISDLQKQVPFDLVVNDPRGQPIKIGSARLDFVYYENGVKIIEEVKGGMDTDISAWKRKHVEAQYGVTVKLVIR